jgi:hypothetical protein
MKKKYETPELEILGDIETLTEAGGISGFDSFNCDPTS